MTLAEAVVEKSNTKELKRRPHVKQDDSSRL